MVNYFTEYSQKRRATGVIIIHREQKTFIQKERANAD